MTKLAEALDCPVEDAAKRLLGCTLVRSIDNEVIECRIVETEAYDQDDPASHSYNGPTPRNIVMFGPAGYLYVYFTYGMHYCMNVVVGPRGRASAVLIRAIEPISGLEAIRNNRRNILKDTMLTNGPGKVCQALVIGREFNGHDLSKEPIKLILKPAVEKNSIVTTTRIGIKKATDVKERFDLRDNPYVSRPG